MNLEKLLLSNEKNHFETVLNKYKSEIKKYQKINDELKVFKKSIKRQEDSNENRRSIVKDKRIILENNMTSEVIINGTKNRQEEEQEVIIEMKVKNETIISDELDLTILKYKNKLLNLPQLNISKEICNFKFRLEKNETKLSIRVEKNAIKENSSNTIGEQKYSPERNTKTSNKVKLETSNSNYLPYENLTETIYNFTLFKNTTEEINQIKLYFSENNRTSFKEEVCHSCLNTYASSNAINEEIKIIESDIRSLNGTALTRQEYILKFSEYVNKINQIKLNLLKMRFFPFLQQELNCTIDNIQLSIKKASQLIEVIQDSIRKHNLNVNFIVLS